MNQTARAGFENAAEERRERRRESQRRYRARHLDRVRESARKSARKARAADPEGNRAYAREYYAKNLEACRAYGRLYALRNPEKRNEIEARRRARKFTTAVEKIDRAVVIARDSSICHLCKKRVPRKQIDLDHLIPLSKGGPHTYENLAVAHKSCNARRRDGRLPAQLLLIGRL